MKYWMTWKDNIGDALIEMGSPLMGGTNINPAGEKTESTKQVSGYSMVQAENAAAAQALFVGHPHLHWHPSAAIEVHECIEM